MPLQKKMTLCFDSRLYLSIVFICFISIAIHFIMLLKQYSGSEYLSSKYELTKLRTKCAPEYKTVFSLRYDFVM